MSVSNRVIVRFGATLVANILRALLAFVSGLMIARALGASNYGDLSFLLGSFAAISQLLDLGTSSAFYTFISQRPRSRSFAMLYMGWILLQFGLTIVVIGLLLPQTVVDKVWLGHQRSAVLLAFASSFLMTQLWGMVSQLGEATRKTLIVQIAAVVQAIAHVVLIGIAIRRGWLTIPVVLWLLVAEYLLLAIVLGPQLLQANVAASSEHGDSVRTIIKSFTVYCAPLVIYGWFGFLYTFADRWLLQKFGGSQQQGFYAIGQQVANISLIATTSILKVFWKEIAEARERKDAQRVQRLFVSVSRSLYFVGAGISCLFIPYSREILLWALGPGYEGAWLCLTIMFLYPIHQALGQIQGTFFYASEETKVYSKIGLLTMAVSIPATYFVLAPRSAVVAGLGLGAVGLALKMVLIQIGSVSLQSFIIARNNRWSTDYIYQAVMLALLVSLGWICKWASEAVFGSSKTSLSVPIGSLLLAGILYGSAMLLLIYRQPKIIGMTRSDADWIIGQPVRWLRSTSL